MVFQHCPPVSWLQFSNIVTYLPRHFFWHRRLPAQYWCSRAITRPLCYGFIATSAARSIMVFLHHWLPAQPSCGHLLPSLTPTPHRRPLYLVVSSHYRIPASHDFPAPSPAVTYPPAMIFPHPVSPFVPATSIYELTILVAYCKRMDHFWLRLFIGQFGRIWCPGLEDTHSFDQKELSTADGLTRRKFKRNEELA